MTVSLLSPVRIALAVIVTVAECVSFEDAALSEDALHRARMKVTRAQVHRLYKEIEEVAHSIHYKNNLEGIAVDALLKDMSQSEKLDPATVELLQNITLLFSDILTDYTANRDEDQLELDHITTVVLNCNTAGVALDVSLENQTNVSEVDHMDCRAQEEVLFDTDASTCGSFTSYLQSVTAPNCVKPDPTVANIPQWTTMIDNGDSFFQYTLQSYLPLRNACVASTNALKTQIEACHTLQNTFEGDFCQWHSHRMSMCATRLTCYNNAVVAHQLLVADIKPISDLRVHEARLIIHMQCLIQNLIIGITDHTACTITPYQDMQVDYNNTYPVIPDMENCSTTPVSIYPGHTDWYLWAYGDLSVKTPADENTGIVC